MMMKMKFRKTKAISKIMKMKARKKVIQGGTSAGKTYGIIPVLIDIATKNENLKITIVAETIPAVKDGAVDIFKEIMQNTNRWREDGWRGNPMQYTFANGTRIQFKAFDSVGKAKSSGKRDILFLNEANHISYQIADALMIRSKQTFIDFNPDNEFWAHTEVLTEPNSEFLLLTYEDNNALPKETLEDLKIKLSKAFYEPELEYPEIFTPSNIRNEYWANWCKVYVFGQVGVLEGVVFNNWKQIDNIPDEAQLIGYGMDFGFTNDPTTLIAVYKYNSKLIVDELIYEKGLTNDRIAKRMQSLGITRKDYITADSSEPKSIVEINAYGYRVQGAVKGADSISFGISILQDFDLLITSGSLNLIGELRKYAWAKDKAGETLNKPIDNYNHCIDALRYIVSMKLSKGVAKKTKVKRAIHIKL